MRKSNSNTSKLALSSDILVSHASDAQCTSTWIIITTQFSETAASCSCPAHITVCIRPENHSLARHSDDIAKEFWDIKLHDSSYCGAHTCRFYLPTDQTTNGYSA